MTNTVQAMLLGVPQPTTSDKPRNELKNNIQTPSVSQAAMGGNEVTIERHAALKVAMNGDQKSMPQPLADVDVVERKPSSRNHHENPIGSGRCNPERRITGSEPGPAAVHGVPSSSNKTQSSTVTALSLQQQERANTNGTSHSMTSGAPGREALKVQVIRPFPVKTAPQAAAALVPQEGPPSFEGNVEEAHQRQGEMIRADWDQNHSNRNGDEGARVAPVKEQVQKKLDGRSNSTQCDFPTHQGNHHHQQAGNRGGPEYMTSVNRDGQQQYSHTASRQQTAGYDNRGHGYRQQHGAPQQLLQSGDNYLMPSSGTSGGRQAHSRSISAGGANTDAENGPPSAVPPTPLFERLVSEEVQEIKTYARIIESQNRQIADLERVHEDLEQRLELLTKERMQLESTLEDRERSWSSKFALLEKARDDLHEVVNIEQRKNDRLRNQLGQKDKDIHRMLARKYDQQRDQHSLSLSQRNYKPALTHGERSATPPAPTSVPKTASYQGGLDQHKSPHDLLTASGSIEAVRERNVANSLLDFFGM